MTVVVRAEVDELSTAPLCEVADLAAAVAAGVLDKTHRAGRQIHQRIFPAESLAHLNACMLLDGDALADVIPGVDATKPAVGYGQWKCAWSSTSADINAYVRFDQSGPLDAGDGWPTQIGGREAFVTEGFDGVGTCAVRVVHQSYPGERETTVVDLLLISVIENEDAKLPVCPMATRLATAAVGALPT